MLLLWSSSDCGRVSVGGVNGVLVQGVVLIVLVLFVCAEFAYSKCFIRRSIKNLLQRDT